MRTSVRLLLVVSAVFTIQWRSAAQAPADGDKRPRLDAYGDPLPEWAIARLGTTRLRLRSIQVCDVAFSPDGKLVASGEWDAIRLWSTTSGKLAGEIRGPFSYLNHFEFSSDGKTLVLASNADVAIVDIATGKARHTFASKLNSYHIFALSRRAIRFTYWLRIVKRIAADETKRLLRSFFATTQYSIEGCFVSFHNDFRS